MKILYILRQKADATVNTMIEVHKKTNDVKIINLSDNKNYDEIVDSITSSDKVISW